ncbi:Uncharacterised protein [Mycobacteroides abscessus subsp. abscessus]|nr:Uncharacterised protein [Mycobacteroides abscessus subsp. abscessus]
MPLASWQITRLPSADKPMTFSSRMLTSSPGLDNPVPRDLSAGRWQFLADTRRGGLLAFKASSRYVTRVAGVVCRQGHVTSTRNGLIMPSAPWLSLPRTVPLTV